MKKKNKQSYFNSIHYYLFSDEIIKKISASSQYIRKKIEFCGEHPFATGIFAILSITGLILSISGYIHDREESKASTTQVSKLEKSIVEKLDLKASKPFFKGNWDENIAFNVAWPTPRFTDDESQTSDKLEKSFFISIQGVDNRIIITSSSYGIYTEEDKKLCTTCRLSLSLFVFQKERDSWVLVNKAIDFMEAGREIFNDVSNSIEVWHVGPERFSIAFKLETLHQGDITKHIMLYSFIANELNLILNEGIHEYFAGLDKKEAIQEGFWFENKIDIKIDKAQSNFGFYDLEIEYSTDKSNKTFKQGIKFDGDKYSFRSLPEMWECKGEIEMFIKSGNCQK